MGWSMCSDPLLSATMLKLIYAAVLSASLINAQVPERYGGILASSSSVVGSPGTSLLQAGSFDGEIFDGDTASVGAAVPSGGDVPYTITFQNPVIVTAIGGFFTLGSATSIKAAAGPGDYNWATECGTGVGEETFTGITFDDGRTLDVPFTVCPEGYWTTQVYIKNGDSIEELMIVGWERPPMVDHQTKVNVTNFFTERDNQWAPYISIDFAKTDEPTCPNVRYTQDCGDIGVGLTDGSFQEDGSRIRIFDIENMQINLQGVYNATLENVYSQNSAPFLANSGTPYAGQSTDIFSLPLALEISRGPFCWIGECFTNETDTECAEEFERTSADTTQVEWLPVVGQVGVCFLTVSYSDSDTDVPHESPWELYQSIIQAVDVDAGADLDITGIPDGVFYTGQSYCYVACAAGIYQYAYPGNSVPVALSQSQCNWMNRVHCCTEDYCFSPSVVDAGGSYVAGRRCLTHLRNSSQAAWSNINECLFPYPEAFTPDSVHGGERGVLTFSVDPDIAQFDRIDMELYDANGNLVRGLDTCEAPSGSPFSGGNEWDCEVHNLQPNSVYYVKLRGYSAADDNIDSGGQDDGLTTWSLYYRIETDDSLTLDCQINQYNVQFMYDDVISNNPSLRETVAVALSGAGGRTGYDSQDIVQTQYAGSSGQPHFIIDESEVELFRGYPSSVTIQSDSTAITHIFFQYSFQHTRVVYGNSGTFSESQAETLSLVNRRISQVDASFDGSGRLNGIKFTYIDDDGNSATSSCYGTGDCGTNTLTQASGSEFVATIQTEMDDSSGYFVALSFKWASVSFATYSLTGDSSCVLDGTADWNEIENYSFSISVSPPSACGSVQTIDPETKLINYTNGIGTGSSGGAVGGSEILQGEGVQVIRGSSGGFNLVCCYNSTGQVHNQFSVEGEDEVYAQGTNEIPFQLVLYSDSTYSKAYGMDTVVNLLINERFYFAAEFKDNDAAILGGMSIYAPDCYATQVPSADRDTNDYYSLEVDGCPVDFDPSFEREEGVRGEEGNRRDTMSHLAFAWVGAQESVVYLHCVVHACMSTNPQDCVATSTDPGCSDGSGRRRRRGVGRESGGLGAAPAVDDTTSAGRVRRMTISSQPLFFIHPSSSPHHTNTQQLLPLQGVSEWSGRVSQLALSFIGGMALLLAKATHSWYKKRTQWHL